MVFNTSLDEGDVVRIIRRSIDVLSQVQYCIGVSNKLKSKAKLALKAINRFPVSESNDLIKVSEDINPATKRIDNNFKFFNQIIELIFIASSNSSSFK